MPKKKTSKKTTKKSAKKSAPAEGLRVPRNQVGATVQAMISFEGATNVSAVEFDAQTFTVTRLA